MQAGVAQIHPRSAALGGLDIKSTNAWGTISEMSRRDALAVGMATALPYSVEGLSEKSIATIIPVESRFAFGVQYQQLNFYRYYTESKSSVLCARNLSSNFSAGVKLNYHQVQTFAESSLKKKSISADIGTNFQLNEEFTLNLEIQNISQSRYKSLYRKYLPLILRMQMAYQPYPAIVAAFGVTKELGDDLRVQSGMEYNLKSIFYLRCGIAGKPFESSIGFGWKVKQFQIDLASVYHIVLGITPHISVSYQFRK